MEKDATKGYLARIDCEGDIVFEGALLVGDTCKTFESGPVFCGGSIIAIDGTLNAGDVHVGEDFVVKTANLEELNACGNVEARYLWIGGGGAYILGDAIVELLVSEMAPVYIGGSFIGEFKGDPDLLHEHFSNWESLKHRT